MNDKRVSVCGISFLPLKESKVINAPGKSDIQISGTWIGIPMSSGEWKETIEAPGKAVMQELKVTVTDLSEDNEKFLRSLLSSSGLLLLSFTNSVRKVVGTDEFPVWLVVERSGNPAKLFISFKRNSPECAKILKSF